MGSAMVLMSATVGLAICEFAVRKLRLAPEIYPVQKGRFRLASNPLIGYELVPNFDSNSSGEMLDFKGTANSLGFRDREHSERKPRGVYRVLFIGDSVTQGFGLEGNDNLYTSVLERVLRAKGVNAEVLNFAVSGYNTQQEVLTLKEKGLRFSPDLAVLAYCINDTTFQSGGIVPNLQNVQARRKSVPLPRAPRVFLSSALYRFVATRLSAARPGAVDGMQQIMKNTVPEYLKMFADLSRQNGFEALVAWFPAMEGNFPEEEYQPDYVRPMAAANRVRFLDLSEEIKACAGIRRIHIDRVHLNRDGHRCVGEALARHIITDFSPNREANAPGPQHSSSALMRSRLLRP